VRHCQLPIAHRRFPAGLFLVLLLDLIFCPAISRANTANDYFAQGVAAYQAGEFPEAATAFQKSAQARPAAGTFINLGLAEWRRGHAGTAILAWEKARWLNPFDRRAAENLKLARAVAQVGEPQLTWFETASTWLPPNAWVWIAGASLWLAIGALVLPRIFRWQKSGGQQWLAALGGGVFVLAMTANIGVVTRTETGFALAKETALRLTPTQTGEIIATLPAGEPARKLQARGNYFLVRTTSGTGWMAREELGQVVVGN
jgi:tetratricopeptide (TPR) repeat protein